MRSGEKSLVRLNIQKEKKIKNIDANRVDIMRSSIDEGVGVGVENGSEGVEDKASMVDGDLKGFGNGGRVEAIGRGRRLEELLLEWD